jgi:aspartate/methionine/tyrosine aminotransferase
VTFSGSVALERAISIAVSPGGQVRMHTPVFDVMPELVREHGHRIDWWELGSEPNWRHAGRDLAQIDATIVVSPDNPSGVALIGAEFRDIAATAHKASCTLIADQSFALLSADARPAELLARAASIDGLWIMTWDTGKTFDRGDEKFGLLIVSNSLRTRTSRAMNLIQSGLSRRLMMQMILILVDAQRFGYLAWLATVRRENEELIDRLRHIADVAVRTPHYGGFSLVDIGARDMDRLIRKAEGLGLGLMSTAAFETNGATRSWHDHVLRVPLLRDSAMMADSLACLTTLLTASGTR